MFDFLWYNLILSADSFGLLVRFGSSVKGVVRFFLYSRISDFFLNINFIELLCGCWPVKFSKFVIVLGCLFVSCQLTLR